MRGEGLGVSEPRARRMTRSIASCRAHAKPTNRLRTLVVLHTQTSLAKKPTRVKQHPVALQEPRDGRVLLAAHT